MTEIPDQPEFPDKMVAGRSLVLRTILRWITGFVISLLLIWAITAVGTENYCSRVWSEELKLNIPLSGSRFNNRYEAWATTDFGELGLKGIVKIDDSHVPKILIWGDSFVAALEVKDDSKMHNQLGKILDADHGPQVQPISIGWRFQSFADYIFQLPAYEGLIQPVALHVIHIHTLEDMYPDIPDRVSLFLSKPDFHFVRYDNEFQEIEAPAEFSPSKDLVFRMRLQFFLKMKKRVFQIARLEGLRFSLATQTTKRGRTRTELNPWSKYVNPEWANLPPPNPAWVFAIGSLQEITDVPVVFVYAPAMPYIYKGRLYEKNPEAEQAKALEKICADHGIGFINMHEKFLEFHHQTGRFYKGFAKSRPWAGHYNADGHRLVAEAIHRWIKENRDVVHPD